MNPGPAALVQKVAKLEAELVAVTHQVEKHQRPGSPPPGGLAVLTKHVMDTLEAKLAEARAALKLLCGTEGEE